MGILKNALIHGITEPKKIRDDYFLIEICANHGLYQWAFFQIEPSRIPKDLKKGSICNISYEINGTSWENPKNKKWSYYNNLIIHEIEIIGFRDSYAQVNQK